MKRIAIILAAGRGTRMNTDVRKQYMLLNGKPLLRYALDCFERSPLIDGILLVLPQSDIGYVNDNIIKHGNYQKIIGFVSGGEQRHESVYKALIKIEQLGIEDACLFIHDGARPFVTEELTEKLWNAFLIHKAVAAAIPVTNTIKEADGDGNVKTTLNRERLWAVQTPQVFSYSLLKSAYNGLFLEHDLGYKDRTENITDDASLIEIFTDTPVKLVIGDYANIKITTIEDLKMAEGILSACL